MKCLFSIQWRGLVYLVDHFAKFWGNFRMILMLPFTVYLSILKLLFQGLTILDNLEKWHFRIPQDLDLAANPFYQVIFIIFCLHSLRIRVLARIGKRVVFFPMYSRPRWGNKRHNVLNIRPFWQYFSLLKCFEYIVAGSPTNRPGSDKTRGQGSFGPSTGGPDQVR